MCHHHHPHPHHAATEHDNADWTADHGSSSSTTVTTTACDDGARDAEAAATRANFVTYGISVVGNPLMGSYSDRHGRRPVLLFALGVSCVPAVMFCWLVQVPTLSPIWYYVRKEQVCSVARESNKN
jgi:MFS family permease